MTYTAPEWVADAIFYQIFPERFCNGDPTNDPQGVMPWGAPPGLYNHFGGDLQGILDRLPYLEELGVNAIYLTPIFEARSNHKYDTCDYLKIDPAFGTLALFKKLVDAAHRRGIRILLDAVFNHCGDGFWAFRDLLRENRSSQYRDWFYPAAFPIQQEPPNYQTCGGAAFLPKLNLMNPEVRDYLLNVAVYWINQCGIDGWRLDVPWKAPLDFWRQFRAVVKKANPEAYIVGEIWRDPSPWLSGDACDGIMNYPLREYILDYCVRDAMDAEDFDYFSARLREVYGEAALFQLNLLGSHDVPRLLTLCKGDISRLALALVAVFTFPGAPMIYYGDEIGMEGGNDPDCRRCMSWDQSEWKEPIQIVYHKLVQARRAHPALRRGSFETLLVFNGVYAFRRKLGEDQAVVVLNPRQARARLRIPFMVGPGEIREWKDILSGQVYRSFETGLTLETLPAKTAYLFVPDVQPRGVP